MMTVAIDAIDLRKTYTASFRKQRIEALRGVSISVNAGEAFGLIGLNGAGKTTFIKSILSVVRYDSGSLEVLGGNPESPQVRSQIGYLPERLDLPKAFTARDFLQSVGRLKGARDVDSQAQQLLKMLVAISGAAARSDHLILDLASFARSPIGEIIVDCMSRQERSVFSEFRERTGRSPLDVINRIAITDDVFFIEGDFSELDVIGLIDKDNVEMTTAGKVKRFYRNLDAPSPLDALPREGERMDEVALTSSLDTAPVADSVHTGDSGRRRLEAAIWDDSILMVASENGGVEEAVGILEGTIPFDESVFPEAQAYGDLFGRMSIDKAADFFKKDESFATRFKEVVDDVYFHVDASEDVAIVADVQGQDEAEMSDLAVAMGGVLSLARLTARADGNQKLRELLDFTAIGKANSGFQLELALPLSYLETHLADCKWVNN